MQWYKVMDMHSGGDCKIKPYEYFYIEAENQDSAEAIFFNRFSRDVNNVTCSCCGEDYSISKHDTLENATAYNRNDYHDPWSSYKQPVISLEDYKKKDNVLIIYDSDIPSEQKIIRQLKGKWIWVED